MNTPLVSIIIPSYNYGRFLEQAVTSAVNQTYPNIEVIIVDDCSTDNTEEIGSRIAKEHPNVRYIRQAKNVGQSANRNTGIQAANGEFVALVDADDWVDERYINTIMSKFNSPTIGAAYTFKTAHYQDGRTKVMETQKVIQDTQHAYNELFIANFIGTPVVFRKSAIPNGYATDLSPHLNNLGVDWWILLDLSTRFEIIGCEEPYYHYNFHDGPQMSNNLIRRIEADRIIQDKFMRKYPKVLSKKVIKEAMYWRYIRESYYMRVLRERKKSILCTLYAIMYNPMILQPYKALAVNLFRKQK